MRRAGAQLCPAGSKTGSTRWRPRRSLAETRLALASADGGGVASVNSGRCGTRLCASDDLVDGASEDGGVAELDLRDEGLELRVVRRIDAEVDDDAETPYAVVAPGCQHSSTNFPGTASRACRRAVSRQWSSSSGSWSSASSARPGPPRSRLRRRRACHLVAHRRMVSRTGRDRTPWRRRGRAIAGGVGPRVRVHHGAARCERECRARRRGVVGAERRRAHVCARSARTSFESRRAGLHSRVLKSPTTSRRAAHTFARVERSPTPSSRRGAMSDDEDPGRHARAPRRWFVAIRAGPEV